MVGVPVLLVVCDSACWPFACVMVVGVWCLGWCCFQWCVAVVCASRRGPGVVLGFGVGGLVLACWRVPGVGVCVCVLACSGVVWLVFGVGGVCAGVVWLVSGVGGLVLACSGVVWLVLVGVCWLVCVLWWFRMLMCLASFSFLGFVFCFVLLFG